ncbi:MAG TPA: fibronectin type III domain-containing protein [Spirochaetota bacterium]|nr:fibronectin type III domain-containing protein [Spirochaetota bacterium]HPJ36665.1 fibronectin type III domain-containing protein [Spirochaetota bacterium]
MKQKKTGSLLVAVFASILISAVAESPLMAEAVFLKDGSIVEGSIISDSSASVTIRTLDKKNRRINRTDIMRILYTELKLGKIYVQKRDGKGIVAHLVDEDRDSYTFRKELFSTEEFTLKRSEVLFMAEKNPSGLQPDGDIETDRISLKWLPPYDPVKKYKLFIKKKQSDKYQPADSTGSTTITIKNLDSNTEYFMIVTAIDSAGNESEPSNELKFKTKNLPPDKPEGIKRETANNKIILRWSESNDADGKVKGYNIYSRDDKKVKLASVKRPEYPVPDNVSVFNIEITAEDDLGSESQRAMVALPAKLIISAAPSVFILTGDLGEMFCPGYGGTFNIGFRNLLFQNFEAGINAGYFTFTGKEENNTDSMFMIPVTAYAGYHMGVGDWFSFFPFVKAGGSYSEVKYISAFIEKEKTIIDPLAAAGISLTAGSDRFIFSAGADYGFLYESAGVKIFYEGFFSCGIKLEL